MTEFNHKSDSDTLARTLYGEARGESLSGKVAVANAILNRVKADLWNDNKPDWWGEGVEGVCLKPGQFSCWNENDPNRKTIIEVTGANATFIVCRIIAELALSDLLKDITNGATHYHTLGTLPAWASKMRQTVEIGNHRFYNDAPPDADDAKGGI